MQAGDLGASTGSLELPASMDDWDELFGFVQSEARQHLNGHSKEYGLMLACEELISNIIRYNGDKGTHEGGAVRIRILSHWVDSDGRRIYRLEISDDGPAFDPRFELIGVAVDEVPIESRPIGGLGLFLIKNSVDRVTYSYGDRRNIYCLDTDPSEQAAT